MLDTVNYMAIDRAPLGVRTLCVYYAEIEFQILYEREGEAKKNSIKIKNLSVNHIVQW